MKKITHRRAQNRDAEIIIDILKEAFEEYEIKLPTGYSFTDIEDLEEVYLKTTGDFIVLTRKQRIIGFFALLPSNNNQVELKRLYLAAEERGKGLGQYLLSMAVESAKQSGFDRIQLETTSRFIQAIGLYRKFGFVERAGMNLASGHDIGMTMDL